MQVHAGSLIQKSKILLALGVIEYYTSHCQTPVFGGCWYPAPPNKMHQPPETRDWTAGRCSSWVPCEGCRKGDLVSESQVGWFHTIQSIRDNNNPMVESRTKPTSMMEWERDFVATAHLNTPSQPTLLDPPLGVDTPGPFRIFFSPPARCRITWSLRPREENIICGKRMGNTLAKGDITCICGDCVGISKFTYNILQ